MGDARMAQRTASSSLPRPCQAPNPSPHSPRPPLRRRAVSLLTPSHGRRVTHDSHIDRCLFRVVPASTSFNLHPPPTRLDRQMRRRFRSTRHADYCLRQQQTQRTGCTRSSPNLPSSTPQAFNIPIHVHTVSLQGKVSLPRLGQVC